MSAGKIKCPKCDGRGELKHMGPVCSQCLATGMIDAPTEKPPDPLPRVICDRCMQDAELQIIGGKEYYEQRLIVKCHDEWQALDFGQLVNARKSFGSGSSSKPWVLVWSVIASDFESPSKLLLAEQTKANNLQVLLERMLELRALRAAQEGEPITIDKELLDRLIDGLICYRDK